MTAIQLPSSPGPNKVSVHMLDWGNELVPTLGGPTVRLDRMGNRHSADFTLPPMNAAQAMAWCQRLKRGKSARVRMPFTQPGFTPFVSPVIYASASLTGGSSLPVQNVFAPNTFKEGQFLSVYRGSLDQYFLYSIDADVAIANTGGGVGSGTLSITPPLRTPVGAAGAGGDTIFVNSMVIEGYLSGNSVDWTIDVAQFYGLAFTVTEAA